MFVFISLMSVAESLLPQRKGAGDASLWREVYSVRLVAVSRRPLKNLAEVEPWASLYRVEGLTLN